LANFFAHYIVNDYADEKMTHTIMLQGALHVNHYHQQNGSKWGSIAAQDVIHAHITYRMTPE